MNCGGRNSRSVRVRCVVIAKTPMTTTIASQNQRKTFRKRLRTRTSSTFCRARVDVADAADGLDSLGLTGAVAELLAEVADVHVDAAVEDRQLATQHRADEVFAFDDEPGRVQELDENLIFDVRQLRRLAAAPDLARARVNLNVADFNASGRARL